MQVREAKDFLVQQTAEQASLEGVPLSDLEKRMMYFTESGYVPEDPIKLNDEFEAEYNNIAAPAPRRTGREPRNTKLKSRDSRTVPSCLITPCCDS